MENYGPKVTFIFATKLAPSLLLGGEKSLVLPRRKMRLAIRRCCARSIRVPDTSRERRKKDNSRETPLQQSIAIADG